MTDPFSLVTGVAGLLGLAGDVISKCYQYGCAVSGAPEEAKRLVSEVTGLSGILVGVQALVKQTNLPEYQLENPLRNCLAVLRSVLWKLQKEAPDSGSSSSKRAFNRFMWPLRKKDTEELITAVERHKTSLSLSLSSFSAEALMSQGATLEAVSDNISDLSANVKSSQAAQQRRDVLDWLSQYQYEAQHQRAYQLYCPNTCNWLLTEPTFVQWSQARSALLWMHGQVGSGKTTATSFLIHHLLSRRTDSSLFAYFYYDASTIESLTPQSFFGAIAKQLCSELAALPDTIINAYETAVSRVGTPKEPSLIELFSFVRLLLDSHDATIIVDGLDESSDYTAACDFLTSTVRTGKHLLRVFISSRPEPDIRRRLEDFCEIAMPEGQVEQDISIYIKSRIRTNARLRRMSEQMKEHVEVRLRNGSNGMFRWVQCQLDEISRLRTDAAVKRALNQLPTSLEGSYSRILATIAEEDIIYAKRILLWLAYSPTPLTLMELAEAIVLEPGFDRFEPELKLNDPNDVLEICRGLVTVNPISKTTRLAHHSVREFLTASVGSTSQFYAPAPMSHQIIAESCISYLLLKDFSASPLDQPSLVRALLKFPLLRYAAQHWPSHVRKSGAEKELLPLIRRLMTTESNSKFHFWLQVVLYDSRHGYLQPGKELDNARPLYYAASYGLTETVRSLVQAGAALNERAGRYGGTALHAAVWRKRPEILNILLDVGADPTVKDYNGASASALSTYTGAKSMHNAISKKTRKDSSLSAFISAVRRARDAQLAVEESQQAQTGTTDTKEFASLVKSQPEHVLEQLKEQHGDEDDPTMLHFPGVRKDLYDFASRIAISDEAEQKLK